jgi:diguanylate cyclase (GGDEF)-like protein
MTHTSTSEKISLLQRVELFSQLSDDELEIVAFNSHMVRFRRGSLIFTEESQSNEMYIIKKGEVLITRMRDKEELDIARFIAGESFGEWDLVGNTPRDATAVAMADTDALVFPKEGTTLTMILHKYPKMSARILHKLLAIIARRIRTTHRLINEKTPWIQNLKRQVMVDKLTGLFNKNFLLDEFEPMLDGHAPTSLLLIKPDNFKEINDRFGHTAGDKALVLMSIFIGSAIRERDIALRYGGDEFAAVLPGASRDEAVRIAREVGRSVHEMDVSRITGGTLIRITLSIGIAVHPDHGRDAKSLMKTSYDRMIRARSAGGNRIAVK